jgi:hypothetical protein
LVRGSCGFGFRENSIKAFTNIIYNVGGVVLQQEVADKVKRGLHDEGAVAGGVKLLRYDGCRHFES